MPVWGGYVNGVALPLKINGVALTAKVNGVDGTCDTSTEIAWDPASDEQILQSGTADVAVFGSGFPFSWAISNEHGSGFTLGDPDAVISENTVVAASDACGTAIITVTDCNDFEVVCRVLCTVGEWIQLSLCDERASCAHWECWAQNIVICGLRYDVRGPCSSTEEGCDPYEIACDQCDGFPILDESCTGCDYVCECGVDFMCLSLYQKVEYWGCSP